MILKPKQHEVFKEIWEGAQSLLVSLPTWYGKSVVFHFCGRLLCSKNNLNRGVTVEISPLNVIQMDQLKVLKEKHI